VVLTADLVRVRTIYLEHPLQYLTLGFIIPCIESVLPSSRCYQDVKLTQSEYRLVKANTAQTAYDEYIKLYRGEYVAGEIVIKVVQNLEWKNANPGS
jgi:hypothetical protein